MSNIYGLTRKAKAEKDVAYMVGMSVAKKSILGH
jgi:hypothetical protein